MELSILLAEQIFSLLLMVLTGYVVRKLNVVPKSGRKVLASIVLYVSAPCIVFDSFQIEYSSEKLFGLVVGFAAACIALAVFIWAASVCKKIFHLSASEQTSVTYANTGNMIIPLVNNILGSEYVLYTSPYNCTQTAATLAVYIKPSAAFWATPEYSTYSLQSDCWNNNEYSPQVIVFWTPDTAYKLFARTQSPSDFSGTAST